MSEFRDKLAMEIHKCVTQTPQNTPHGCDFECADKVTEMFSSHFRKLVKRWQSEEGYRWNNEWLQARQGQLSACATELDEIIKDIEPQAAPSTEGMESELHPLTVRERGPNAR